MTEMLGTLSCYHLIAPMVSASQVLFAATEFRIACPEL